LVRAAASGFASVGLTSVMVAIKPRFRNFDFGDYEMDN
jgi:hypothetical protein